MCIRDSSDLDREYRTTVTDGALVAATIAAARGEA